MRASASTTFLLVTRNRVARADVAGGDIVSASTARAEASSLADAVRAAMRLGKKASRSTWLLAADVWTQELTLSPAQVAGLNHEQLSRALAFEVEPFSGMPVMESTVGFRQDGAGAFSVAQIGRAEREGAERAVAECGGRLLGITHPGPVPESDSELTIWWAQWPEKISKVPCITAPPKQPSESRFAAVGAMLEVAALAIVILLSLWLSSQKQSYEKRNEELNAVAGQQNAENKRMEALRLELAELEKQEKQREGVFARKGALLSLLNALAVNRPDDVVIRGMNAEGPSAIVIKGVSLEAGAVDQLSIALTKTLKPAGWVAQPRNKTGKKSMTNGGPWEFSLALIHEETARGRAMELSQREPE